MLTDHVKRRNLQRLEGSFFSRVIYVSIVNVNIMHLFAFYYHHGTCRVQPF